jgi:hypothetical protein
MRESLRFEANHWDAANFLFAVSLLRRFEFNAFGTLTFNVFIKFTLL